MKKLTKVLSCVLAALIVWNVIPISASAEDNDGKTYNQDTVNIKMSVGGLTSGLGDAQTAFNKSFGGNDEVTTAEGVEENAKKSNGMFVEYSKTNNTYTGLSEENKTLIQSGSGTEKEPYVINQGDSVYLAIDLDVTSAVQTDGVNDKGIGANSSFSVQYEMGMFVPASATAVTESGVASTNSFSVTSIRTNPIDNGSDRVTGSVYTTSTDFSKILDYYPGGTAFTFTATENKNIAAENKDGIGCLYFIANGGTGYLPDGATWDTVIKLTAAKSGTAKLYIDMKETANDTNTWNTYAPTNAINIRNTRTNGIACQASEYDNPVKPENVTSNEIYFNILGTDPEGTANAKIGQAANQTVEVPLSNCTWSESVEASSFTLTPLKSDGTEDTALQTQPTKTFDKTKSELTIDASSLNAGTKYALKIAAAAVTPTKTGVTISTNTIPGGTIYVMKNMDGSVKIKKGENEVTTAEYGDELTASYTVGQNCTSADDVVLTWYRSNSKGEYDVITKTTVTDEETITENVTGGTYTLTKADVGKTIKVVATHADYYGSTEASTSSAVSKKALTQPTDINKITIPATSKGTATAKGTYTFTTDNDGIISGDKVKIEITATYDYPDNVATGTASGKISFTGTLDGDDKDYYTFTKGDDITFSTGGTVTDKGYNLTAVGNGEGHTDETLAIKDSTGTTAVASYPGGDKETLTLDLQAYEAISSITAVDPTTEKTLSGVTVAPVANTRNQFTIKAEAIDTTQAVQLKVTIKKYIVTLGRDNFTFSENKTYDGTTALSATTLTWNGKASDDVSLISGKNKVNISITGVYTSPDAGTTKVKITDIKLGGDDAAYYKLGTDLAVGQTIDVDNGIQKATMDGASVTVSYTTSGTPTVDGLVAAILNGQVIPTITGVNDTLPSVGTVSALMSGTDEEAKKTNLTNIVNTWIIGNAALINDEPNSRKLTYTDDGNGTGTITDENGDTVTQPNIGDTIEPANPVEGAVYSIPTTEGFSIDPETGVLTIGTGAVAQSIAITATVTADDGTTTTKTTTLSFTADGTSAGPGAAVYGYDITNWKSGTPLTIDITDALNDSAQLDNFTLPTDSNSGSTGWPTVTASVTYTKRSNPAPASGVLVSYDTQGYGKPDMESENTDSDGKLTAVPGVTTVKGAYFCGWTLKKGNAQTMYDPENPDALAFEEDTTLYALIKGYLSGDGAGHAMPADKITKEQMATMLVIASSVYDVNADYGTPTFGDVGNSWATKFIARAEALGFISGYDGAFEPKKEITRNEAARMIADAFGVEIDPDETTDVVSDFDEVPTWAKKYVAALCNRGVIQGRGDGQWHGEDTIRRDEAAVMINVFLGMTAEKAAAISADETLNTKFTDLTAGDWNYAPVVFASLSAPAELYSYEYTMPAKIVTVTNTEE